MTLAMKIMGFSQNIIDIYIKHVSNLENGKGLKRSGSMGLWQTGVAKACWYYAGCCWEYPWLNR